MSTIANETTLTIVGTLTADPELRFTPSGVVVANFTVASNSRVFHQASGQWRDGDPLFMRCQLWREPAENIAESLAKGTRVIATGRLQQRSYEDRHGENRPVIELLVDEIGPSLNGPPLRLRSARAAIPQRSGQERTRLRSERPSLTAGPASALAVTHGPAADRP